MSAEATDPKGLIREAYRIEGITEPECRSIFLDWALSVPTDAATDVLIGALLVQYGEADPEHPMTGVLREGLETMKEAPKRRGGSRARSRD